MLETLDHTIRIGSTPTFLYFDLYLYSAYAAHYVYVYLARWAYIGSSHDEQIKISLKNVTPLP